MESPSSPHWCTLSTTPPTSLKVILLFSEPQKFTSENFSRQSEGGGGGFAVGHHPKGRGQNRVDHQKHDGDHGRGGRVHGRVFL
jgi:hypothetical protein